MKIKYTYAKSDEELKDILALQSANHYSQVTKETQAKEGFLTVKHNLELLNTISGSFNHIIAKDNENVVGYALLMIKEEGDKVQELITMFEILDNQLFKGIELLNYNYCVMGQVCIDKEYRGHGIFEKLYQNLRKQIHKKFSILVTEISTSNLRSLRAHSNIGFLPIHQYKDDLDEWVVVVLEL